jgi:membrane-associated phospholipid phosphatase
MAVGSEDSRSSSGLFEPGTPKDAAAMSERASRTRAKQAIPTDRFILSRDLASWRTRIVQRFVALLFGLSYRIGAVATLAVVLLSGVLLTLGTATGATELYEATVEGDGAQLVDTPALHAAMAVRSPPVDVAVTAYTTIGGPIGMTALAGVIMAVLAIRRRSWSPVVLVVLAAAGSVLITVVSKQSIGRARPPLSDAIPPYEYSDSFPSGHALNSLVLASEVPARPDRPPVAGVDGFDRIRRADHPADLHVIL